MKAIAVLRNRRIFGWWKWTNRRFQTLQTVAESLSKFCASARAERIGKSTTANTVLRPKVLIFLFSDTKIWGPLSRREKMSESCRRRFCRGERASSGTFDLRSHQRAGYDDRRQLFRARISRLHGYMAEFLAESADWLVKIPPALSKSPYFRAAFYY